MTDRLEVIAIGGMPEIGRGAAVGTLVAEAAAAAELALTSSDVVVISQKAVSKAEGRVRDLGSVTPGERAARLAAELDKDPRLVELILAEAREVIRAERGVLIAETRGGWVCANAGVDSSNVPGEETVALLPEDADASAVRIRSEIREASGVVPAVVIADSFGRAWRLGQSDVAIGCAGLVVLDDWEGRPDRDSRPLAATNIAIADEVAAAADLAREKDGGTPAVLVRGLERYVTAEDGPGATALRRAESDDLFR